MVSRLTGISDFPAARHSLVLLVGAFEESEAVFRHFPWATRRVACFREADPVICRDLARVILCEHVLRDGSWKDVLDLAESRQYPPPVVVTSRQAGERLWAEVLNLGGYDVLANPLDRNEALRTITLAWARWNAGRNWRDLPDARLPIDGSYVDQIERDDSTATRDLAAFRAGSTAAH